jgi:hypothetical protein
MLALGIGQILSHSPAPALQLGLAPRLSRPIVVSLDITPMLAIVRP